MNYIKIYEQLINKAIDRLNNNDFNETTYYETHHIQPRSQGGGNNQNNLVPLTVKEHFLAHKLLYKIGDEDQIFSIWCFIEDSLNPKKKYRYQKLHNSRWIRKAYAFRTAELYRIRNRNRIIEKFHKQIADIDEQYTELWLNAICID